MESDQANKDAPVDEEAKFHEDDDSKLHEDVASSSGDVSRPSPSGAARPSPRLAWLQVMGSFFLFCNTWGIILAFGAFQAFYEQDLLRSHSSSDIAWIGTSSACLLLLGGATSGKLYDLGYSRVLIGVGSATVVFGLMMTSLGTRYYEIFLAQGIVLGLGTALLWIPALTIVAAGFGERLRPVAIGVVSAGSSVGGVIYPIMFRRLQPEVGFPWAVRTIAFVALGTFVISFVTLLPAKPARRPRARQFLDKTAFTDVPFLVLMLAGIPVMLGYFVPLVFLPLFAESGIHDLPDADVAFYMLAIVNGASLVSRILGGFAAIKLGACLAYAIAVFVSAVLTLALIGIHNLAGLVVWAVLWGMSTGLIISLFGAIVPQLCSNLELIGTRMGMSFFASAIGILIGGPIGGKLIFAVTPSRPTWWPLQVFAGISMFVGFVMILYPCKVAMAQQQARRKMSE